MASSIVLILVILFSLNPAFADTCGGLLEGETGHFSFAGATIQEQAEAASSACLWVIQMHYENNVRFTLNALDQDAHLNLYSEDQLTSCSANDYTKVDSTNVGSSFEFRGKTLIVVLPNSSASVGFSWSCSGNDNKNSSAFAMKNSDYVISPSGLIEWEQLETEESVTWGINTNTNFYMRWDVDVPMPCDQTDNCACIYFAIFQLNREGIFSEALRTCGQSSEGQITGISERALVLIKVNAKVEARKVTVSWGLDDATVTKPPVIEPPVTEPPVSAATGLFAATSTGLISLDLRTLEVTQLTSDYICAVAVNNNLRKVYWYEYSGSYRIMRSNFDGSGKEVVVSQTAGLMYMLAIDEASGNVYYRETSSHEIKVCNAQGQNCAVAISDPSLSKDCIGIALDLENGFMYWAERRSASTTTSRLVRANLDGSNTTILSTKFNSLHGITLLQPSHDVLYYVDYGAEAIGTIDVDGGNKRTLVELEGGPGPWGIQVDSHKIYIGNSGGKNIQSADRVSGKELTTIFNSTGNVVHLALFSAPA